jgi:hypothetical protein
VVTTQTQKKPILEKETTTHGLATVNSGFVGFNYKNSGYWMGSQASEAPT